MAEKPPTVSPEKPPTRLPPEVLAKAVALANRLSSSRAAAVLGLAEVTLLRALAGREVRRGSVALICLGVERPIA